MEVLENLSKRSLGGVRRAMSDDVGGEKVLTSLCFQLRSHKSFVSSVAISESETTVDLTLACRDYFLKLPNMRKCGYKSHC